MTQGLQISPWTHVIRHQSLALLCALALCLFFAGPTTANASSLSQTEQAFIDNAFNAPAPKAKTMWLSQDQKKNAKKILRHKYHALRVRYWQKGDQTVWVLDEVGKYKPITVGLIIKDGAIADISVLEYRESHGWEVKHEFFTQQFLGARLTKNSKLTEDVDGISGATLSVRALKKLARLALYFDSEVTPENLPSANAQISSAL